MNQQLHRCQITHITVKTGPIEKRGEHIDREYVKVDVQVEINVKIEEMQYLKGILRGFN